MEQEKKWIRDIVKRGSRKAADALIRSYYDEIYIFVYRQTGNREDALDLTQECFLAVLRSLPSYDAGKSGFRTWLYHIAAHKVIDMRRKQKPLVPLPEDDDLTDTQIITPDFVKEIHDKELLTRIEQMVQGADPQIQEIFRLRIYAGYSFPQIAAAVSQPEAKIKAQYYRLAAKIRKEFQEYET